MLNPFVAQSVSLQEMFNVYCPVLCLTNERQICLLCILWIHLDTNYMPHVEPRAHHATEVTTWQLLMFNLSLIVIARTAILSLIDYTIYWILLVLLWSHLLNICISITSQVWWAHPKRLVASNPFSLLMSLIPCLFTRFYLSDMTNCYLGSVLRLVTKDW